VPAVPGYCQLSAKHPEDAILPCLDSLTDDIFKIGISLKFIIATYENLSTIVEVPKDTEVKAGDEIEIIPEKCSEGKFQHLFRFFRKNKNELRFHLLRMD
jgi:hypothetical protein